ncbi:hypothetical protein AVEN_249442-1, partial [Araneus ventricosus]
MYLSGGRCSSSSAEAGIITAITGQGPTPPEGGTHYPKPSLYPPR